MRQNNSGKATHILILTSVREEPQELELAQGAQAEEGVLEWQDLLDGDLPSRRSMERGNDGAVCTFAQAVQQLVVGAYECWHERHVSSERNGSNVPTSNLGRGLATFC